MFERNEEGLIVDNGEIRECESNIAKMGLVRTWWHFYGYKAIKNTNDHGRSHLSAGISLYSYCYLLKVC